MPASEDGEKDAIVSFREITRETVISICRLSDTLSDAQKRMVAPNAQSIAEAYFEPYAWFRAIYANDTPIGFVMLYDDPNEPKYFLWRLMIAGPWQRCGYGKEAMSLLIAYVRTRPGARELLVSCEEGEASPEGFYERLGFRRNGEVLNGEVVLSLEI